MKRYLVQTPKLVQWLFPQRVWAFSRSTNAIYLTFDDGPIPEVTPWVLQQLKKYDVKATFFCIGDNVRKYPEIFRAILADGHAIGNHTHTHLKGSRISVKTYLADVERCRNEMRKHVQHDGVINISDEHDFIEKKLFRPPYGKMTSRQAKALRDKGFRIVMWDILSADFDTEITQEKCLQNVIQYIKSGSVVVFHDSLKAEKNLRYVLPKVLDFVVANGYSLETISL